MSDSLRPHGLQWTPWTIILLANLFMCTYIFYTHTHFGPHCGGYRTLILQPGIKSGPLTLGAQSCRVLATGPPGKVPSPTQLPHSPCHRHTHTHTHTRIGSIFLKNPDWFNEVKKKIKSWCTCVLNRQAIHAPHPQIPKPCSFLFQVFGPKSPSLWALL